MDEWTLDDDDDDLHRNYKKGTNKQHSKRSGV